MMIIGIGGCSNAGKSALTAQLAKEFSHLGSAILCLDDYVFPEGVLPRIRGHVDWEHPSTIDFPGFNEDVKTLAGQNDLVIAEGFLVFSNQALNHLFNKMIFIQIQEATFRKRKALDLRWGKEPGWYTDHIWESFKRYGQPPSGQEALVINGEMEWPMTTILSFLNI